MKIRWTFTFSADDDDAEFPIEAFAESVEIRNQETGAIIALEQITDGQLQEVARSARASLKGFHRLAYIEIFEETLRLLLEARSLRANQESGGWGEASQVIGSGPKKFIEDD